MIYRLEISLVKAVPVVFRSNFENPFLFNLIEFFLLKHLTLKLYVDSISADSSPTSGSGEKLKIKTSNAIGFRYRRAEVFSV